MNIDDDMLRRLAACAIQPGEFFPEDHVVEMAQEILKLREQIDKLEDENWDLKNELSMTKESLRGFSGSTYKD